MKDKTGENRDSAVNFSAERPQEGTPITEEGGSNDLIIVGVGASAGGLDALQKLLPGLPANVGMAFVIVQHLAPKYHSVLPSLLAKYTDMRVETITDAIQVLPDKIYITPPNKNAMFSNGRLLLRE